MSESTYHIDERDFGIRVTFRDEVEVQGVRELQQVLRERFAQQEEPFAFLLDRRDVKRVTEKAVNSFTLNENIFRTSKLRRIAILIDGSRVPPQLELDRLDTQLAEKVRYFDVAEHPDAEEEAIRWLHEDV